ncbi:hypothetical protein [Parashewanella spongiae]|uniref:hypothetical protein n=1 Tax=Parashewanella spongiae TaxID=342950 RepID=UPI00105A1E7B|nr:hypothetical protein [Parashewanella spongiae]
MSIEDLRSLPLECAPSANEDELSAPSLLNFPTNPGSRTYDLSTHVTAKLTRDTHNFHTRTEHTDATTVHPLLQLKPNSLCEHKQEDTQSEKIDFNNKKHIIALSALLNNKEQKVTLSHLLLFIETFENSQTKFGLLSMYEQEELALLLETYIDQLIKYIESCGFQTPHTNPLSVKFIQATTKGYEAILWLRNSSGKHASYLLERSCDSNLRTLASALESLLRASSTEACLNRLPVDMITIFLRRLNTTHLISPSTNRKSIVVILLSKQLKRQAIEAIESAISSAEHIDAVDHIINTMLSDLEGPRALLAHHKNGPGYWKKEYVLLRNALISTLIIKIQLDAMQKLSAIAQARHRYQITMLERCLAPRRFKGEAFKWETKDLLPQCRRATFPIIINSSDFHEWLESHKTKDWESIPCMECQQELQSAIKACSIRKEGEFIEQVRLKQQLSILSVQISLKSQSSSSVPLKDFELLKDSVGAVYVKNNGQTKQEKTFAFKKIKQEFKFKEAFITFEHISHSSPNMSNYQSLILEIDQTLNEDGPNSKLLELKHQVEIKILWLTIENICHKKNRLTEKDADEYLAKRTINESLLTDDEKRQLAEVEYKLASDVFYNLQKTSSNYLFQEKVQKLVSLCNSAARNGNADTALLSIEMNSLHAKISLLVTMSPQDIQRTKRLLQELNDHIDLTTEHPEELSFKRQIEVRNQLVKINSLQHSMVDVAQVSSAFETLIQEIELKKQENLTWQLILNKVFFEYLVFLSKQPTPISTELKERLCQLVEIDELEAQLIIQLAECTPQKSEEAITYDKQIEWFEGLERLKSITKDYPNYMLLGRLYSEINLDSFHSLVTWLQSQLSTESTENLHSEPEWENFFNGFRYYWLQEAVIPPPTCNEFNFLELQLDIIRLLHLSVKKNMIEPGDAARVWHGSIFSRVNLTQTYRLKARLSSLRALEAEVVLLLYLKETECKGCHLEKAIHSLHSVICCYRQLKENIPIEIIELYAKQIFTVLHNNNPYGLNLLPYVETLLDILNLKLEGKSSPPSNTLVQIAWFLKEQLLRSTVFESKQLTVSKCKPIMTKVLALARSQHEALSFVTPKMIQCFELSEGRSRPQPVENH